MDETRRIVLSGKAWATALMSVPMEIYDMTKYYTTVKSNDFNTSSNTHSQQGNWTHFCFQASVNSLPPRNIHH